MTWERIALFTAGIALAATGVARLSRAALSRMPAVLAAVVVFAGAGVVALGVVLHPPHPPVQRAAAPASPTAEPPPVRGTITGVVSDAKHSAVAGASVVLERFERTAKAASTAATTSADGTFAFRDLPTGPTTVHVVSTEFGGTTFRTGLIVLDAERTVEHVDLVVAPTTEDAAQLSVAVDSTVLVGDRREAQVVQILNVRNPSDRAYVGGLRLPLLPGAAGFRPREGLDQTRLIVDGDEIVSSAPVLPGDSHVVYEYAVAVPATGLSFQRTFHYPTERFAVLTSGGLGVRSRALRPAGKVTLSGRRYESFRASRLSPGRSLRATVAAAGGDTRLRTGIVVAAVVAAVGVIVYPLVRRRKRA